MNTNYWGQEPDYDISLDAELWAKAPHWAFEEFDYLAVGLDPQKVREADPEAALNTLDDQRKAVRNRVSVILRGRNYRHQLSPAEFIQVAHDASIALPEALIRAVKKRASEKQQAVPSSAQAHAENASVSSIKYKKLLKMFLAVAVEQYGYVPGKPRQDAVMDIIRDAKSMEIHLDDQTVRDRLREAKNELEAHEEEGLMAYINQN